MSLIHDLAAKVGFIQVDEHILKSIPAKDVARLSEGIESLNLTETYQNPTTDFFKRKQLIEKEFQKVVNETAVSKGYPLINTSTSILGYAPAGSVLQKLFPNPYAVFSFIGNNYWAASLARKFFRCDMYRDGYKLVASEKVSNKRLQVVQAALDDLFMEDFRVNATDHLNVYGNVWIDRDRNKLGGLNGLQILLPEKILPIMDTYGDFVIGWEYIIGNKRFFFNLGELDHLKTYDLRSYQLGVPSLAPMVPDIEASLHASVYNNEVFRKGGLVRAIVSMGVAADSPTDPTSLNENTGLNFSQKVYEMFVRQFSGVRSAGQLAFLPDVKGVYPVTTPKDMEGIYAQTEDRTASKAVQLLGVRPQQVGLHSYSQYENKMSLEDNGILSCDNYRYYLTNITDSYINRTVFKEYLGIEDIQIQYTGEYTSLSRNAAEFGKFVADMGTDVITVNEFRTRILHWEPLDSDDGSKYLGHYLNQAMLLKEAANSPDDKDRKKYLEKAVGPEIRQFKNELSGEKFKLYNPRDIRLL